ncbi:B12-binding domain-containing radical SAM protein [Fictibacillus barbaricus]|uniref:Anaerobic magnesium-protoporphyrin IX monomethyl ester cyclase n=1 Tax=Fictibacillus barbaricus TaxID=182136 RepID=A0ABU1TXN0_9BACL|nr:B12-binding domain-containing radical SAM protein [Fictibacillus barbaricus]MDR7071948.1 anaerobic magnesium-protoporphyrin IX monomethyl ester cyclase [Fictibacillus barbaricus]
MKTVLSTLNAKYIHTCLALRYLKAYSQPEFPVTIREFTIKDPSLNIVTDLFNQEPDVLGFSCYIWNIEETIKIIQMFKKIKPETKIVLGGPEVSYDVAYWLDRIHEVDFIVVNEGEETFKHLLNEIQNDGQFNKVAGLAYRMEGKPKINGPREKLDLKKVTSPFRFEEDVKDLSKRITYFETSRGCPYSCAFCLSSIEVGVRYFDPDAVKEDLIFLMDNGARIIKFVDRTFNIRRDYALDMFSFLIENRRPGVVFQFEITADIMRPEVIDYLNEHAPKGLFRFEIGVQSTNDAVNLLVERRQNFEKLTRTVTNVRDGGKIVQHLDLIAGLPKEDYTSFRKTFNDVFAFGIEEVQLGFLKMLRGTGLRLTAEQHDYVYMDHSPYEILGNNVLSFEEIIRIKQVEDVLEKYWNDHRMDHTVKYLINHVFESPFDFFQEFGTYWETRGWSRIGHQLEDLFKRLIAFLTEAAPHCLPVAESLMKLDYLERQQFKPRKPWWENTQNKEEASKVLTVLANEPNLMDGFPVMTEKDLHKHGFVAETAIDPLADQLNSSDENSYLLIALFDPKLEKTQIFTLAKSALQIKKDA